MTGRNGWLLWMVLGPAALFGACESDGAASTVTEIAARGASPLLGAAAPAPDQEAFEGVVVERLAAGGYTYLRVEAEDASHWVAVMGAGEPEGTPVGVRVMAVKDDFRSRRLDRTFARLLFATVQPSPDSVARR